MFPLQPVEISSAVWLYNPPAGPSTPTYYKIIYVWVFSWYGEKEIFGTLRIWNLMARDEGSPQFQDFGTSSRPKLFTSISKWWWWRQTMTMEVLPWLRCCIGKSLTQPRELPLSRHPIQQPWVWRRRRRQQWIWWRAHPVGRRRRRQCWWRCRRGDPVIKEEEEC